MAGGKLSPRQKMVNLMYLVFIAMLAMNMSKEVLSAFGSMNEKLTKANTRATETNKGAYETLGLKASEQPLAFGSANESAKNIKELSSDLYAYIGELKTEMTADVEDKTAYESMDKSGFLDNHFFANGKISDKGTEFMTRISDYKTNTMKSLDSFPDMAKIVSERFKTDDVKGQGWLKYNYEGFPLVASLTKLTQIQADIKATESESLSTLLSGKLSESVSLKKFEAMVVFDKNAYYPGEKLSGKVILAKKDDNLTAEKVVINGKEVTKDKIQAGQVILDTSAGGIGDKKIEGTFTFMENGEPVDIEIKGGYSVIPKPNSAVISADKMNVFYRGLSNPVTISMAGVKSISASGAGLRKVKGASYTMTPGSGNEVNIKVTGKLPDGGSVSDSKKFRIKDIPPAVGAVRNQYGTVPMPKSSAGGVTVSAKLPDFLFDLKLNVSSFKVKVPGQVAVPCSGSRMNARAKQAINKARRGDAVTIFDIKGTANGAPLKKILPVIINITN